MPFGFLRTSAVIRSLSALPSEIAGLRRDVHSLQAKVQTMSTAQDQVTADIALIKSEVATMAANYTAAAAAAQTKALADAQAAWQANDDAAWTAAHAQLTDVITAMSAGQPITPPATAPTRRRRPSPPRRLMARRRRRVRRAPFQPRRQRRRPLSLRPRPDRYDIEPGEGRALFFASAASACRIPAYL